MRDAAPELLGDDWDRLTPQEFQEVQEEKLVRFIREQLYPFSPHYRELFDRKRIRPDKIRSVRDLAQLPFTVKKDIVPDAECPDRPRRFILQPTPELIQSKSPLAYRMGLLGRSLLHGKTGVRGRLSREYRPSLVTFTTGRSAQPTPFAYSLYDLEIMKTVGSRICRVLRLDPEQGTGLNVFPYAPHLAFWQVLFCGLAEGILILHTGGGKVMGTEPILDALRRARPHFLMGIPGYLYHLMRRGVERKIDASSVRKVILGGERASPGYRVRLQETLSAMGSKQTEIHSVFGFTEARCCWSECEGGSETGFHLYPDIGLIEVIDPDTELPLSEGETGEVVFTTLEGRGTALLRYRTGDIAEGGIRRDPCPACGRTVPRLSGNIHRRSNVMDFRLTKIKGTLVDLNVVAEALQEHPAIEEWQLVIRKPGDDPNELDELELCFAPRGNASSHENLEEEIASHLAQAAEVRPNRVVRRTLAQMIEQLGMENKLKEERIVDQRPRPS
jgi:phenylacetate-coenzyme A ligase PaaK-like adenylate-forming protein